MDKMFSHQSISQKKLKEGSRRGKGRGVTKTTEERNSRNNPTRVN